MKSTIRSSVDVSRLFSQGKRFSTPFATVLVLKRTEQHDHDLHGRVAFIAGKKNGNAVWRNAAKRRMRALCADFGGSISGLDIVFLAKRRILQLPYQKLQNEGMKIMRSLRKEEAQRNEQEA